MEEDDCDCDILMIMSMQLGCDLCGVRLCLVFEYHTLFLCVVC